MPVTDYSVIHHLDAIEAAAYKSMYAVAPRTLVETTGLTVQHVVDATLFIAPGLPDPFFNRVLGLGNQVQITSENIDTIIRIYQQAGISDWWLQISESINFDNLYAMLSSKGFTPAPRPTWAKCSMSSDVVSDELVPDTIREVIDDEAEALATVLCQSFGMPDTLVEWFSNIIRDKDWRGFAAFNDEQILGGGLLYIHKKDAWLGGGGVLPAARGRHIHRNLLYKRMHYAKSAGCELLITETGEPIANEPNPSLNNILATGFTRQASRKNFQLMK